MSKKQNGGSYLLGVGVKGDVLLDAPWPDEVDLVLVEGEEEDDEDEDGVDHGEGEANAVAELP